MGDIPEFGKFEIRGPNDEVVGWISAEELARLREENEVLYRQMVSLLPKATPEQEAEMAAALATAVDLDIDGLIREIEADQVR